MKIVSNVKKNRDNYTLHSSEGFRIASKTEKDLIRDIQEIYEKKLQVLTVQVVSQNEVNIYCDNEECIDISVKVNEDTPYQATISDVHEINVKSTTEILSLDVRSLDEKYIVAVYDGVGV